ncbi:PAAR-like domain-containing protein [bacterium]
MKNKIYQNALFAAMILVFCLKWNIPSYGIGPSQQQIQKWTPQSQDSHRLRKELINILEMSIQWGGRDIHITQKTWEDSGFRDAAGRDYNDFKDDKSRMTAIDELAWNESGAEDSTTRVFASFTTYSARNRGLALCFPDVCKTPAPPSPPISIPYPNIAKSTGTKTGIKDTKVDVKADTVQSKAIMKSRQRPQVTRVPVQYTRQQEIVRFRKAMKELLLRKN